MAGNPALKLKMPTLRMANAKRRTLLARTIPEQIADHLAIAIIKGEFRDGEHLPEQKVAALFNVSHGPVREAIRTLSKRGLVEFQPRRGAFVIGVTLDAIADIFNIRAVLLGLSAHSLARLPSKQRPMAALNERAAHIRALAGSRGTDPETFAHALGRLGALIFRSCSNAHLTRILREEAAGSLWGDLWREHTLDFLTQKRRNIAAADWVAVVDAIAAGDGARASRITRKALFDSRDSAIETLQRLRGETVSPSRFVRE
ncbi:GntR family transcriptional regulator [Bradyrhizobium sp. LHD-71]|uniref:GntR family transcriptional regulator n=1 Tax=Bradyrhizobium sp. LHD-71 TaxID=3072141 RepID=UPI00280C5E25|nr:GntR family transcriptional regulator [Bradyrhizobium sp. LHD-71]MDQ8727451.1 GntR family transcriptional regulator [Bradyrhizobium sp. LHD-71]